MIKESECCSEVTEPKFNKLPVMNKKDNEDFKNSTKCCVCKKEYEEGEVKVKDHDHITGKCPEYSHQDCNLNLSLSKKKSLLFFIIFKTVIYILSFKKLENTFQNKCYTKTNRKIYAFYHSTTRKKDIKSGLPLVFIDRVHF